jgi:hypothetical protein
MCLTASTDVIKANVTDFTVDIFIIASQNIITKISYTTCYIFLSQYFTQYVTIPDLPK